MMERELLLHRFVLAYARKLCVGLDDVTLGEQPAPGMNSPRWVLGHLAICCDYAAGIVGLPPACPKGWHRHFGPGSDPATPPTPVPTKAELLAALEAGHARLAEAVPRATEAQLAAPSPFEPAKAAFPTAGDLLAHLLTTHPSLHLGQLSAWRRLRGLPAVLGF